MRKHLEDPNILEDELDSDSRQSAEIAPHSDWDLRDAYDIEVPYASYDIPEEEGSEHDSDCDCGECESDCHSQTSGYSTDDSQLALVTPLVNQA